MNIDEILNQKRITPDPDEIDGKLYDIKDGLAAIRLRVARIQAKAKSGDFYGDSVTMNGLNLIEDNIDSIEEKLSIIERVVKILGRRD